MSITSDKQGWKGYPCLVSLNAYLYNIQSFTYDCPHLKNEKGLNPWIGLYFGDRRSIEKTYVHKNIALVLLYVVCSETSLRSPFIVPSTINNNIYTLNCLLLLCYKIKMSILLGLVPVLLMNPYLLPASQNLC